MERLFDRYDVMINLRYGNSLCVVVRDILLNNDVKVLKILGSDAPANIIKQIKNEVVLANGLNHANLGRVSHFEQTDNGTSYIVVEYVPGVDLSTIVKVCGRLSESVVKKIALQLAAVLSYLHEKGVIHKDVKLSNIVLNFNWTLEQDKNFREEYKAGNFQSLKADLLKRIQTPKLKLIDLGISFSVQNVQSKKFAGTQPYSSLEQLKCQPLDGCTDIFSAGATEYELLTGRLPHISEDELSIIAKDRDYLIKKMTSGFSIPRIIGVSNDMNNILAKMLRFKKMERYQSMKEVIRDLEKIDSPDFDKTMVYATGSDAVDVAPIITTPMSKEHCKAADDLSTHSNATVPTVIKESNNYLLSLLYISLAAFLLNIVPPIFGLTLPVLFTSSLLGLVTYIFAAPMNLAEYHQPVNCALGVLIFSLVGALTGKIPILILHSFSFKLPIPETTVAIIISSITLWVLSIAYIEENTKTTGGIYDAKNIN